MKKIISVFLTVLMICGALSPTALSVSAAETPDSSTTYSVNVPVRSDSYDGCTNPNKADDFGKPTQAVDDVNTHSYWMVSDTGGSTNFPHYLLLDLGEEKAVNHFDVIGLNPQPEIGWTCAIEDFEIFGSNDPTVFPIDSRLDQNLATAAEYEHASWVSMGSVVGNEDPNFDITVPQIGHYRYIMLRVSKVNQFETNAIRLHTFSVGYEPIVDADGISVDANCKPTGDVYVSDVGTFTATVTPLNTTFDDVIWSSSDPSVIEVDDKTGEWKAVGVGTATITAITVDGTELTDSFDVTAVPVLAESIAFDYEPGTIDYGSYESLSVTIEPYNTTDKTVTWESSNPEYVSVDAKGKIHGLIPCTSATITATTVNGISVSTVVNVDGVLADGVEIIYSVKKAFVGEGGIFEAVISPDDASVYDVVWSSSNQAVIVIDAESGVWEAVGAGTATITAATKDGSDFSDSFDIAVIVPIDEITVETDEFVNVGDTGTYTAIITPENATITDVIWESSDSDIIEVDENGNWTAKAEGDAIITVFSTDGSETYYDFWITVDKRVGLGTVKISAPNNVIAGETFEVEVVTTGPVEGIDGITLALRYDENIVKLVPSEDVQGNPVVAVAGTALDHFKNNGTVKVEYLRDNGELVPGGIQIIAGGYEALYYPEEMVILKATFRAIADGDAVFAIEGIDGEIAYGSGKSFTDDAVEDVTVEIGLIVATDIAIDADCKPSENVRVADAGIFTATVTPLNATFDDVIWTSSDPSVIRVNQWTGKWMAIGLGTATITATTNDGTNLSDSFDISVIPRGDSVIGMGTVKISAPDNLVAGDTFDVEIVATGPVYGINGITLALRYDESVVELIPGEDMQGNPVVAVAGAALDHFKDQGRVLVDYLYENGKPIPGGIQIISGSNQALYYPEEMVILKATFRAIAVGDAGFDIGFKFDEIAFGNGISLTTDIVEDVTVEIGAILSAGIAIDADCKPTENIRIGDNGVFTATVTPEEATWHNVFWTSSDPSVISVNENTGEWEAIGVGTATITAATIDGTELTDSFDITVLTTGDVNGDGKITIVDALAVFKHLSGKEPIADGSDGAIAADVNADTKINISDALAIFKHLAGKELIV